MAFLACQSVGLQVLFASRWRSSWVKVWEPGKSLRDREACEHVCVIGSRAKRILRTSACRTSGDIHGSDLDNRQKGL